MTLTTWKVFLSISLAWVREESERYSKILSVNVFVLVDGFAEQCNKKHDLYANFCAKKITKIGLKKRIKGEKGIVFLVITIDVTFAFK